MSISGCSKTLFLVGHAGARKIDQREDREGRDVMDRFDFRRAGEPQDLGRALDVGRLQGLVGVDEVHQGAVVIDHVDPLGQLLELARCQSEARLGKVARKRDQAGRVFIPPQRV